MNRLTEIFNAFNSCAETYESAAKIQYEIGLRLFERLDWLKIDPQWILDLGCGPGLFTTKLTKKYPKARIVAIDLAQAMLKQSQKKQNLQNSDYLLVNADMMALPFPEQSFDLVFANQSLHWALSIPALLKEINRIMRVNSCLMFSTLGPDTFMEIKQIWQRLDQYTHINEFLDMHILGDELLAQHFIDPVVDMERITAHYSSFKSIFSNLKAQGIKNISAHRNPGLTGKKRWEEFKHLYDSFKTSTNAFPLTYEVIYGHAWKGNLSYGQEGWETVILIDEIKNKRSES